MICAPALGRLDDESHLFLQVLPRILAASHLSKANPDY